MASMPSLDGIAMLHCGVYLSNLQSWHPVKISILSLDNMPRALAARDTCGLTKLVADAEPDRFLEGCDRSPTRIRQCSYPGTDA